MVVLLCKHPAVKKYDISSIRMLMSGAAPLSSELINQLSALLPDAWIGQAYGPSHPTPPHPPLKASTDARATRDDRDVHGGDVPAGRPPFGHAWEWWGAAPRMYGPCCQA